MEYEFHEAANIFPLDEEHLDELAADIKAHGLQVPIELLDGLIIDGRRRYLACGRVKVEPEFRNVKTDDPVSYVLSLNLQRRHLTTSQAARCAMRAEDIRKRLGAAAKQRSLANLKKGSVSPDVPNCARREEEGKSRDKLASMFGVSHQSVSRAKQIEADGIPELGKAVDDGLISVNRASHIATQDEDLQKELLDAELQNKPKWQPKAETAENGEDKSKGKAIYLANKAVDCLRRIPKNDPTRSRGFQIVMDWIRHNK